LGERARLIAIKSQNPFERNRKVEILTLTHKCGRHSDHLSTRVHYRSTARAFRDRRGYLESRGFEIVLIRTLLRDCRDYSLRHRLIEAEWAPKDDNAVAGLRALRRDLQVGHVPIREDH